MLHTDEVHATLYEVRDFVTHALVDGAVFEPVHYHATYLSHSKPIFQACSRHSPHVHLVFRLGGHCEAMVTCN
jgi:hypothetical protein